MLLDPKIPRAVQLVVDRLVDEWNLEPLRALSGASCSSVTLARSDSQAEVVLKVPFPETEERSAYPTLQAFAAHGGVAILRHDEASGATLMPMIHPGFSLAELDETEATTVCAELIRNLRGAPPVAAPNISSWFDEIVDQDEFGLEARRLAKELLDSTTHEVLLHGDLHHGNILRQGGSWVAIDPKGILGDPAFEVTGFMRNPHRDVTAEMMCERLRIFAEILGDPIERLWAFAFVQTVVSYQGDEGQYFRPAAEAIWAARL